MFEREQTAPLRLEKCRPGWDMVGHQFQFLVTEGNQVVSLIYSNISVSLFVD